MRVVALEPSEALANLASGEGAATTVITAAFRQNYEAYSDAERQDLLDGIERMARGEVDGEEKEGRRSVTRAFAALRTIGLDPEISAPEAREIPARLLRIYRESDRHLSKSLAVLRLGEMLGRYPEHADDIEEVMVSVASAPFSSDRVHPQTALDALRRGGEAGIPVLRRLHEQSAVQHPGSLAYLRKLAERGFPLERVGAGPPR